MTIKHEKIRWQDLVYRTGLGEDELKRIPASSCENNITELDYYVNSLGIREERLFEGVSRLPEDFKHPGNWLSPIDEIRFHVNMFRNAPDLLTHYDAYKAGLHFKHSGDSLFLVLVRLMSLPRTLREMAKHVRKFNNEYNLTPLGFSPGHTFLLLEDFPYYREISLGHECHFVRGMLAANFEMHDVLEYDVREIVCGKKIANIVEKVYGRYGWSYHEDARGIYIDNRRIGKRIALKSTRLDKYDVFMGEIDEHGVDANGVLIVEDFNFRGRKIFSRGEIYEAPYCFFRLKWKETGLFQRILSCLPSKKRNRKEMIREMEEQIEFTHAKLFELNETLNESEKKSRIFRVYTRSSLAEYVDSGRDPTLFKPREEKRAILFNDLRGFTSISEKMRPIDVVSFLNEYFDIMNNVILENRGEIDKLIGDCIMASFERCDDAVRASIQMKERVLDYNRMRVEKRLTPVSFGVGIGYGPVVIGNIGSDSKMDYTLIGDTVNSASRIESLTKHYHVGIVISREVFDNLSGEYCVRPLGLAHVKGRKAPVNLYEVFDYEPEEIRNKKIKYIPELNRAFELHDKEYFAEAGRLYVWLIDTMGPHRYQKDLCLDPVLNFFLSRCVSNCELLKQEMLSGEKRPSVSNATMEN